MNICDACGEQHAVITIGSTALCKACADDVSLEMTKLQSEGGIQMQWRSLGGYSIINTKILKNKFKLTHCRRVRHP